MANVQITQLNNAQPLDGSELVPIVQNGVTVRTTTGAIAASPAQDQTFITVNQESTLPNSRSLSGSNGIAVVDNGAQNSIDIQLNGTSESLENAGSGLIVKEVSGDVVARDIATSGAGIQVSNGDGQAGNPTLSLTGLAASLANLNGTGILALPNNGTVTGRIITGTADQIVVLNGDGAAGDPTISISPNPIIPGTGSMLLPDGTTAERPAVPLNGMIRYNTDLQIFEGYANNAWGIIPSGLGVVTFSAGTTGLTPAVPTVGNIVLGGTLNVANGGTGATDAANARLNLSAAASGANSDITSLSGITGSISSPTYIQLDTTPGVVALAEGKLWWDATGALNIGMGGSTGSQITQQVGEEFYVYGKASSLISDTNLLLVYKTGTVGASGVVEFAPTIAGISNPDLILGVATETIALNGFGRVTSSGIVRGINTTGTVYGEVWADNDTIWYNPVTGGLTKTKPSAPNIKLEIGTIINAGSGGSGSFFVKLGASSQLGGTDSNVQFGSLSNGDLLVYDSSLQYWKNAAQSTISAGSAANISGGSAGAIPYQTGAGATTFLSSGSGVLVGGVSPSYTLTPSGLTSITLTQNPTSAFEVTTKQYVDNLVATGIVYHTPVKYEVPSTTGNLVATYNNGTAGVGATLTNADTLAAFTPDGVTAQIGDRVLIYNQTNQFENGIYEVTTVGDGSTPWVLTRTTDADSYGLNDSNSLGEGSTVFVMSGNTGAGETYTCNTSGTITFGTTAITFVQVAKSQVYSAGTGLSLTGTVFSLTTPVVPTNGGTGISSYAVGDLVYANTTTTLDRLTIGAASRILTSSGTAPGWTDPASVTVGSATTATTATNVAGGVANQIVYNTAAGTTSFITAPSVSSTFLKWNGSAFTWDFAGAGTVTSVDISAGTTGLTFTGGPITASGTITAGGTLAVANGGTNGTATPAAGAIAYGSGTAYAFSLAGTANQVLLSGGTGSPTWANQSSLSVGSASTATSATTATNLAGGAASQIPYQTGAGATTFLANGTAGQVLKSNGASAPSWSGIDGGTF